MNTSYNCSVCKKTFYDDYSALTEAFKSRHKAPKLNIGDDVRITYC